jgi:hypothetical protein
MTDSNHPTPYNWLVNFSFAHPKSDLRPEDQRWGQGTIPLQTDKIPETEEEFKEIARHIGKLGGYEVVAVQKPLKRTDHFVEDTGEVLEGFIVND